MGSVGIGEIVDCPIFVTLGLAVRLNLRFLRVVSVLGFLLLPSVMQICGKRVFRVMQ